MVPKTNSANQNGAYQFLEIMMTEQVRYSRDVRFAIGIFVASFAFWQADLSQGMTERLGNEASGAVKSENLAPNLILILADDLGYGELGCQGNPEIPTPNIDQLASTGIRCTQAYVTAPNCSPSRAGLLTGRTPTRFGYEFNPIGARNEDPGTGIPNSEQTLAEALKSAGYATGIIGKWHLGGSPDFHPLRHGFDEFFGFLHEGHYYEPSPWNNTVTMLRRRTLPKDKASPFWINESLAHSTHTGRDEPAYDANNPLLNAGQPIVEEDYLTDVIGRESCQFIERYQETSFFLYVAFNAVHSPLQAKRETFDKFASIEDPQRRIFAAMLHDMDRAIGEIINKVDELNLRERTMIVFLSDNGGPTKELTSSNFPLRAGKGSMYEGGLRVPFIVNWPTRLLTPGVHKQVVSSLDVFPTALELAGLESPGILEGESLLKLLAEDDGVQYARTLFWRQGNRTALLKGQLKLVDNDYRAGSNRNWELYQLDEDEGESNDISDKDSVRLDAMIDLWKKRNSEMQPPLFPR